ncbi:MAG TPA: hypothetical protein VJM77_06105, partial [Nitrospiria bacterium]|nr:hypothetical protein [Nitrospiria bacterium]
MGFIKVTRLLSIICLYTLSLLTLTGDQQKKSPERQVLPFDPHQVIEKVRHPIKQHPYDKNTYLVEASSYRAEFGPDGFVYKTKRMGEADQSGRDLRFSLSAIRVGQENLIGQDRSASRITAEENTIVYYRTADIREIYEAKKIGIEQSWEIQTLPSSVGSLPGDLAIEGRITTPLIPSPNAHGGLDFFDQDGKYLVSYSKATVIDAKNQFLEISPTLVTDGSPRSYVVTLSLPGSWLAEATFPVIVDPLIGTTNISINADAGAQDRPAVAYSGTNYLVVWQDGTPANAIGGSGPSALADIKGQIVNPDGTLSGTVISIDLTTGTDQTYPAVAYGGGSCGYFVVYQNYIDATNLNDVYGRCVTTSGTTPNPAFAVVSGTREDLFPAVAFNSSTGADFLVLYGAGSSGVAGSPPISLNGQQVTCNPTCVNGLNAMTIGSVTVAGGLTAPYVMPSIAFGSGQFVVVWEDFAADTAGNVIANTVSSTWTVGTPFNVAATTTPERFPSVAFGGTDFLVVWQNGATGGSADIYGQRVQVTPSIGPIGPQIFISTALNDERTPKISFNGTNYLVVWQDSRNSTTTPDVYGAGVTPSGSVLDTNGFPFYQGAAASTSVFKQNPAVIAGGSNFLTAWSDNRNNTAQDCISSPQNCDL